MRPPRLKNLVLCLGIGFFGRGELPALLFFRPRRRELGPASLEVLLRLPSGVGSGSRVSVEPPEDPLTQKRVYRTTGEKRTLARAAVSDDHGGLIEVHVDFSWAPGCDPPVMLPASEEEALAL